MASSSTPFLQQQQPPPEETLSKSTSGSIAPFFVAMSILTVLGILSCVLGRIWTRGSHVTPLEISINTTDRSCLGLGWLKCKWRWCLSCGHDDVESGSKALGFGEHNINANPRYHV